MARTGSGNARGRTCRQTTRHENVPPRGRHWQEPPPLHGDQHTPENTRLYQSAFSWPSARVRAAFGLLRLSFGQNDMRLCQVVSVWRHVPPHFRHPPLRAKTWQLRIHAPNKSLDFIPEHVRKIAVALTLNKNIRNLSRHIHFAEELLTEYSKQFNRVTWHVALSGCSRTRT